MLREALRRVSEPKAKRPEVHGVVHVPEAEMDAITAAVAHGMTPFMLRMLVRVSWDVDVC